MGSSFSVYNDTDHAVWIQQGTNWDAVMGSVVGLGTVLTLGAGAAGAAAATGTASAVAAAEAAAAGTVVGEVFSKVI